MHVVEPPKRVRLTRCATGQQELAEITRLNREDAKNLIDAAWWMKLGLTLGDPADEVDRHWKWRQLVSAYQNKWWAQAICVKSSDGAVQAAALFQVNGLSVLEVDQGAVFLDRLATAPRNRDTLVKSPLFRGGGRGLLLHAVAFSYSLGFSGRLNLFPVANEDFYLDLGFVPTDVIQDDEPLFELPAAAALSVLKQRGLING